MKSSIIFSSIFAASAVAAPLSKRDDIPSPGLVFDQLIALCDKIGGTPITSTVCKTVTGLDVGVAAADPETGDLAKVTVSGGGLLEGASITIPVASLDSILGQLSKRSQNPVNIYICASRIKCSSSQVFDIIRSEKPRAVSVDLGGVGVDIKREAEADFEARAVSVDLGGVGVDIKREAEADDQVRI
ncbi:hypothetical protein AUEXF2481DRAFT_45220 [Aureobasidium subglaciale EXF-2481]|uniref:Uncharacterized protein n=1 Tax=Aureobasidium subglaciale (strain EXF-2481) TaxID=1043005 RepID=A0A074YTY3_AURSE|nr:uncharacterized protein AUEXF2481DRAFT_45220 [Aureobasidium subglaciale EXF-2481]KAI5195211.1 hypothetical protein E4T38_09200 [Aureobasidium subglaciale]KAI5214301.1 hypothetical protein E4T40_09114 [Aureobasidium subglaciale]KAI5216839.1 hypothetical protein E4T41_09115 [Aureobasidium subglaciale]KAI5254695.1 hypothetical protein E4T46_09107 [Aureobasidium subglaciale]KEQ90316.1 hypothetical protein AUEXF2481DRAFT_45220 [Aureobasidium subglaciale EXF-2481]